MTGDPPINPAAGAGPIKAPCPDCGKLIKRQCAGHVDRGGERHRCHRTARYGTTVCGGRGSHGGNAPQVKALAARRVQHAQAVAVFERYSPDAQRTVDVPSDLAAIIGEVRNWQEFLAARLAEFTASEWHYSHPDQARILAVVGLYEKALDRAGRFLIDVARLGVEAAIATQAERLEQSRAQRIVDGFEMVLAALDLDERQQAKARGLQVALLLHLAGEAGCDTP